MIVRRTFPCSKHAPTHTRARARNIQDRSIIRLVNPTATTQPPPPPPSSCFDPIRCACYYASKAFSWRIGLGCRLIELAASATRSDSLTPPPPSSHHHRRRPTDRCRSLTVGINRSVCSIARFCAASTWSVRWFSRPICRGECNVAYPCAARATTNRHICDL